MFRDFDVFAFALKVPADVHIDIIPIAWPSYINMKIDTRDIVSTLIRKMRWKMT